MVAPLSGIHRRFIHPAVWTLGLLLLLHHPLAAQSVTEGALVAEIILGVDAPVLDAIVSLEDESGATLSEAHSDLHGRISVPVLSPGRYSLRVEKSGFAPLRQRGIVVVTASLTTVRVRIVRRPPPITRIEEVAIADQRIVPLSPLLGGLGEAGASPFFAPRTEFSEAGRNSVLAAAPRTQAWGFEDMMGGLPQSGTRLMVDGLPATWMRHPAVWPSSAGTPALPSYLMLPPQIVPHAVDVEWVGGNGGMVSAATRRGTSHFRFEPFVYVSGKPGIRGAENPGDSSLTSVLAGTVISGTLVKDKAQFLAGFHYQELELPGGRPWEADSTPFGGASVGLSQGIAAVAADTFGRDVSGFTRPLLRSYRGGAGGVRIDYRLSPSHAFVLRSDMGRFRERNPELGRDILTSTGGSLESRDFTGSLSWVGLFTGEIANELRFGYRSSRRDWDASSALPTTYLPSLGAGIGISPAAPANFTRKVVDLSESVQFAVGRSKQYRFKFGFNFSSSSWSQDYLYGSRGIFAFGTLDDFGAGSGSFYVAESPNTKAEFTTRDFIVFGQMVWQLRPSLTVLTGLRYDRQRFPQNSTLPIPRNQQFGAAFGLPNNRVPDDRNNVAPHLGVVWTSPGERPWTVSGGFGWHFGQLDPTRFAEAINASGQLRARRGLGNYTAWPALPDTAGAPDAGQVITLFDPNDNYKNPRTRKFDLQLDRALPSATNLRITGGYHHTDYLLRREDLNLLVSPAGRTQEGRPVFGVLAQRGGLVTTDPGSNRRIPGFDLVSGLVSTGFSDYYQAGLSFSRAPGSGIGFSAAYLWSRTRDNTPQSWTGDPADELSPFPTDPPGHEWVEGVSDYDLPHRASLLLSWKGAGHLPLTVATRYRYRSGFPYTPGFRAGVDVNADGSGRNDPAFVDAAISGMQALVNQNSCIKDQVGGFVDRNSCRAPGNHALDLNLALGLPVRSLGGRLELSADIFNLVSTSSGIVDHALVLIDPAGTLVTDGLGNVTLPLIANPRFGKLLSRRTEPRILRLGLRIAY
ncbi:MAG: carboxypeptidase regulatory-like domain-containing protein [Gemmatimonadales bacterium]